VLLIDTGVFVSAADRDEPSHNRCAALLSDHRDQLATTGPVVAETAWMIESRLGPTAESTFVAAVGAGKITVIDLTPALYQRCVELIDTYADLGLGLVDASLVAAAEHYDQTRIATLNHRDFTVVRPSHTDAFDLLPGPA
jgi:uncharacterized protein